MSKGRLWTVLIAVVIILGASGTIPLRAEVNMSEGKWEVTTQMTMEGMGFQIPATTTTQCITKENVVPSSEKEKNCKVLSHSIKGNTVTWKVKCVDKNVTTEGEGEITYSGNSYKGNMVATMTEGRGKPQTIKMNLSGKRIGECTDADRKAVDNLKAQAEKAQAQARPAQEEYEAKLRRAQELAKLTVPEDGPNACLLSEPNCETKFGKLNLLEGQWEIVEEGTSSHAGAYTPAATQQSVKCLTERDAVSYTKEQACVVEKKRSGNRITWKNTCTYPGSTIEEKGGITYNGDTYDGVKVQKTTTKGMDTTTIAKLSGRRTGDGNCIVAQRDYTSKKQEEKSAVEAGKEIIQNPVKSLKKLFGR
jgi:hypothetical protein